MIVLITDHYAIYLIVLAADRYALAYTRAGYGLRSITPSLVGLATDRYGFH